MDPVNFSNSVATGLPQDSSEINTVPKPKENIIVPKKKRSKKYLFLVSVTALLILFILAIGTKYFQYYFNVAKCGGKPIIAENSRAGLSEEYSTSECMGYNPAGNPLENKVSYFCTEDQAASAGFTRSVACDINAEPPKFVESINFNLYSPKVIPSSFKLYEQKVIRQSDKGFPIFNTRYIKISQLQLSLEISEFKASMYFNPPKNCGFGSPDIDEINHGTPFYHCSLFLTTNRHKYKIYKYDTSDFGQKLFTKIGDTQIVINLGEASENPAEDLLNKDEISALVDSLTKLDLNEMRRIEIDKTIKK